MKSLKFGRLLDGAIGFLARYEKQNVSVILVGLAEVLKTSDTTIEEVYELVQQCLRIMGPGDLKPDPGKLAALISVTHGNPKAI